MKNMTCPWQTLKMTFASGEIRYVSSLYLLLSHINVNEKYDLSMTNFFFFLMGNTSKTLLISRDNNYILVESLFKKIRNLFNPNRQVCMPKAYFASKWTGLLPLWPTCEKSTHLKEWDIQTLKMTYASGMYLPYIYYFLT